MTHIHEIAAKLDLKPDELEPYGTEIAKVKPVVRQSPPRRPGKGRLVLVTAITPSTAGEGKTTTSIGLAQGLARMGESVCLALREPSLGPCFGIKGGGTGGGRCQVLPAERINLHFTGDFHAVTAAHNLLAAMIDNHLHFRKSPRLDPRRILWPRVLDMNDRALRHGIIGLGGVQEGIPRESRFDITAASEVMAMICLAEDAESLRNQLERTLVAYSMDNEPVTAEALSCTGAMLALLRDALLPNLVRTSEGVPALVHGGPFANIAHGCSSVLATRTAMHLADWTITEAGFGSDLGTEKFFHIKCRGTGLDAAAVILVVTIPTLRTHGSSSNSNLTGPNVVAVEQGLANLDKHVEIIASFGKRPVVALNRFPGDSTDEIHCVRDHCEKRGIPFAVTDHFQLGGVGSLELAEVVRDTTSDSSPPFHPLYESTDSVKDKILTVATKIYGARDVAYSRSASRDLREIARLGYSDLPICVAKTHMSLSDNARRRGRPRDFSITVEGVRIQAGAGFLVVLTGDMTRMPGLPREPLASAIDLVDDRIIGMK
jgi:formate--tetrahydrofolate ligase